MRRPALLLLVSVLLVSCSRCGGSKGGPTDASAVSSSSAPTASASAPEATMPPATTARFAYAAGPSLCVESALPTALGEAGCTKLPASVEQFAWVDGERIAALLASGDVVLVGVVRGKEGVKKLPMPADSTWSRPPPRDKSGNIETGANPSKKAHLFVKGDEVWLAKCPWWSILDAGACYEWVSARLSPSPAVTVSRDEPPGFREHSTPRFAGAPPADVKITVKDVEMGKAPPIVCQRGAAKSMFVPEGEASRVTVEWTWIPESASSYLANVTYDHIEAESTTTYLMKACESKPVMELRSVIVGPGAYWIHADDKGWTVRHGDREIGTLKGDDPQFAPSAP